MLFNMDRGKKSHFPLYEGFEGGLKVNSINSPLVVYFLASVAGDLTWRSMIMCQLQHNVKAQETANRNV